MPLHRVHVLTTHTTHNSLAFNLPLTLHQKMLRDYDVEIHFFYDLQKALTQCDVLFVNSKYFRSGYSNDEVFQHLQNARKYAKILLWFDTTDSTGAAQFEVLPYVDGYYKNQILKDKTQYLKPHYASRIFTDYYHNKYDINDTDTSFQTALPQANDLDKIRVSWNSSLGDYGPQATLYQRLRKLYPFSQKHSIQFVPPPKNRHIPISCRINRTHKRQTILFQRNKIAEILEKEFHISTQPISPKEYYQELENASIGISPFGWGEIAYRDYEVIISGAALAKPDMSHLKTWPPLYESGVTYIALRWDMEDFTHQITEALSGSFALQIALQAQEIYQNYLITPKGHNAFCKRLNRIITRHQ